MNKLRLFFTGSMLLIMMCKVFAGVEVNPLFCDQMVLQRDARVPVWGNSIPGEKVTVKINNKDASAVTDMNGKWRVNLPKMKAGGPFTMTIAGATTITLKDVYIGEVWLASGQSNMEYPVGHAINGKQEIADANYPAIRFFTVRTVVSGEPLDTVSGKWEVCNPANAQHFSAVAYFFARELYQKLKIPIGIIHSSVSGTLAEAWVRPDAMRGEEDFAPIFNRYDDSVIAYAKAMEAYNSPKPGMPKGTLPVDPSKLTTRPGGLYNGKIAPLVPYAIRGAIWWQGEYNSERCEQYKKLFPLLITAWRAQWGYDFPFYFVQLQNLDIQPQPNLAHYDEMREAQLYTWQTVKNTGMAVMCDAGDKNDIHPPNKQEAGRRLALIARAQVYKENIAYSGPIYRDMDICCDSKIRLHFSHTDGGLASKSGEMPGSFMIAGKNKKFVPALAKIDGDSVIVWNPDMKTPVAVRYAWSDNPICTLYNGTGLPASPFRTDNWFIKTSGKN